MHQAAAAAAAAGHAGAGGDGGGGEYDGADDDDDDDDAGGGVGEQWHGDGGDGAAGWRTAPTVGSVAAALETPNLQAPLASHLAHPQGLVLTELSKEA